VEEVSRKITDSGLAVEKIYLYLTIHLLLVNHTLNQCIFFVPKCNLKLTSNMQLVQRNTSYVALFRTITHLSGTSFLKERNLSVTLNAITTGNFEHVQDRLFSPSSRWPNYHKITHGHTFPFSMGIFSPFATFSVSTDPDLINVLHISKDRTGDVWIFLHRLLLMALLSIELLALSSDFHKKKG